MPVPRYTSYPPANFFHSYTDEEYLDAVDKSNDNGNSNISFYLHLPFCRRLCHYCGCNSYPMSSNDVTEKYIKALHKEIDIVAAHLDKHRPISQIHYGGGSPTAMPANILKELNGHILSLFPSIDKPEIAIECHPGYLSHENWEELTDAGFNRFSIGIQDFDERVLKTANRVPSALPMEEIFSILRKAGATINTDFLFGLPYQTPKSFLQSIERAIALHPDRLVTFSYGHVPWVFKRQQILEKIGLPDSNTKSEMFNCAARALHEAGYMSVGLDHFVLPDDELYTALQTKRLHRNFQGYCTRRTTGQVYAFGVTGISQLDNAYAQNTKDIAEYISLTDEGKLTTRKGYQLSDKEQLVRAVIESVMCNYHINWNELAKDCGVSIDDIKAAVNYDESKLTEMQADGIITYNDNVLSITSDGNPFVRNVAALLDPLMKDTTRKFSKPI